jgi:hypothetical protein
MGPNQSIEIISLSVIGFLLWELLSIFNLLEASHLGR